MVRFTLPVILLLALLLPGCASSPKPQAPAVATTQSPTEPAASNHDIEDLASAFGGEYKSPDLASYVTEVGKRVAAKSEHSDMPYTFTVLDTPIVNAFAGPNGDIYVTRGMLALVNNEAQLAGVLGHEIGHAIAARQVQSSASPAGEGQSGAEQSPILLEMRIPALKFLIPFSSDKEYQADLIAARSETQAGYDPRAMSAVLASIREYGRLTNQMIGNEPDAPRPFDYLAKHQKAVENYDRALSQTAPPASVAIAKVSDKYIDRIDGISFGERVDVGVMRGPFFEDPKRRIRFVKPRGSEVFGTQERIYFVGRKNSLLVLDTAPDAPAGPLKDYLATWAKGLPLRNVRAGRKKKKDVAYAVTTVATPQGPMDLRIFVMLVDSTHLVRLRGEFPSAIAVAGEYAFLQIVASTSSIPEAAGGAPKERRLKVVDVRAGDTVPSLAKRGAFGNSNLQFFRALNGLSSKDSLSPGCRVKLVVQ